MAKRRKPTLMSAFDLASFGAEAWMVVGLRMVKLAAGGPGAMREARRMVSEKASAAVEAQMAAGMALLGGASHNAAGNKAMAGYRRRVRANRKRLMGAR